MLLLYKQKIYFSKRKKKKRPIFGVKKLTVQFFKKKKIEEGRGRP